MTARVRAAWRRLRTDDSGQITPWTVFGVAVVIVLAGFVFDVAMAMAEQVRLQDRAQAAARAGAQQIDLAAYRDDGVIRLNPDAATTAARQFLARSATSGTATATTTTVTVTVTGQRTTQLLTLIGVRSIPINASAEATAATGVT